MVARQSGYRKVAVASRALVLLGLSVSAWAQSAYVRVNQIGYEADHPPFRAYLMTTAPQTGATFQVVNSRGSKISTGSVGALLGAWGHSKQLAYQVYALDFDVPGGETYSIKIAGPVVAQSPRFAVDSAKALYSGLLLNSRFFFETQRDGRDYVRNALRTAAGHLNDEHAKVYQTPLLDEDDQIATSGRPLSPTGRVIDASGGWWDAGDYMKYVETVSYTVALQEIGIRDFPRQLGQGAPIDPPAPPAALSYAGQQPGSPSSSNLTSEAEFGLRFLLKMWDNRSRTLYYQVGNSQDWDNFDLLSDYDIWRLPQDDDAWDSCSPSAAFICHRPVFQAGPAGAKISPNLAGRLAASFATCYVLNSEHHPALANTCLESAENVFELANTGLADPAASVDAGSCTAGCLLTIIPFDGYPETVWSDDMELGATELYFALKQAHMRNALPRSLLHTEPMHYLAQAAYFARNYVTRVYNIGASDTLNLYDVSGLAHFELYRALQMAGDPDGLAMNAAGIRGQLLEQVDDSITHAKADVWGFGASWTNDTASHGAGISVMASEAYDLTGRADYARYARQWMANILGANAWGSSFVVGDGSATFPNCIQHQVANLAGALNGTNRGTPVLWGAVTEGPSDAATSGQLDGMIACPANGVDAFRRFNGNTGAYGAIDLSVYQDNVESYSTTEPAIDLTSSSFLMWAWRLAEHPAPVLPQQ